jgi:hypothetical protein
MPHQTNPSTEGNAGRYTSHSISSPCAATAEDRESFVRLGGGSAHSLTTFQQLLSHNTKDVPNRCSAGSTLPAARNHILLVIASRRNPSSCSRRWTRLCASFKIVLKMASLEEPDSVRYYRIFCASTHRSRNTLSFQCRMIVLTEYYVIDCRRASVVFTIGSTAIPTQRSPEQPCNCNDTVSDRFAKQCSSLHFELDCSTCDMCLQEIPGDNSLLHFWSVG